MPGFDDRLTRELERAARPADPSRAFERIERRRRRRARLRKVHAAALAVVVIGGTVSGFVFLSNAFRGPTVGVGGEPQVGNGLIVYSEVRDAGEHLWVAQPSGTGARQLTTDPGVSDSGPAVSPDGQTVAFVRTDGSGTAIYTIRIDGTDLRRITPPSWSAIDPTWAPDNVQIAFVADAGDGYGLYVMAATLDGAAPRRIVGNKDLTPSDPAWSSDGSTIAFSASAGPSRDAGSTTYSLWTVDATGLNPTQITTGTGASDVWPSWSPDGSLILFVRGSGSSTPSGNVLMTIAPHANATPVALTDGSHGDQNPAWSPDGELIVFDRSTPAGTDVYTMRPDGSELTLVARNASDPAWQPVLTSSNGPSPTTATATATPTGPGVLSIPGPTMLPGLSQPVCNVTQVTAEFWSGVSTTAYVYQHKPDVGGCPAPGDGFTIVGIARGGGDVTGSYGPLDCQPACHIFAAPDVDGDGLAELAISQTQGASTVFFMLYRVVEHAPGVIGPTLVPVSAQIAWGGPVTQPEGAYCIDGASGRELWVWQASPLGTGTRYHVSEHGYSLTGDQLKSDVENSYDVPDMSKLPEGGGATLCGAPVVP